MTEPHDRNSFSLSPGTFTLTLAALASALIVAQTTLKHYLPPRPTIVLSEFCAHNGTGIRDRDGDHSDWIELYNPGTNTVDLLGWYLTDSFQELTKWRFPSFKLGPGQYGVVFASGKDRTNAAAELHTNFKLSDRGEYLALVRPDGMTVAQDFFPKYPPQRRDVSYGLPPAAIQSSEDFQAAPHRHRFFAHPTPGDPNCEGVLGLVGPVRFSRTSGFYDSALKLSLSAYPRGTTVYYTTDGSTPSATNGTPFTRAIPITTTTVVRAIALRAQFAPSDLACGTYIFIPDVAKQTGEKFPASWGSRSNAVIPAHYAMSAEIVNDPAYQQRLREGLRSIPSVSIVTDLPNLFDPVTGIYTHPMTNGPAWERPASVEMIELDHGTGFRINCGLRIQGGWNRRPEESPKHSLRLLFKKDYGPAKLRYPLFGTDGAVEFDTVILRGGNNNSWLHWNFEERRRAEYARDQWMRESFQAMGYPSARGRFVHVYLNGLYWGLYNLCERPSAPFLAANEGGSRRDYDSMKAEKVLSGDKAVWHRLMALANSGLRDDEKYRQFQECVDLTELTDYLILNFYGGNADWDRSSNWYAGRRRTADGKYQFFVWDGERTLEGIDVNSMDFDDDESPPRLFHKLAENADYRMFFADRVQKLLFNGGPLTAEPAAKRYQALAQVLENPLVAESARWGSYRRDINPYKVGPYEFYKPDVHWRPEVNRLLSQYFAQRPAAIVQLFRERGLYPR